MESFGNFEGLGIYGNFGNFQFCLVFIISKKKMCKIQFSCLFCTNYNPLKWFLTYMGPIYSVFIICMWKMLSIFSTAIVSNGRQRIILVIFEFWYKYATLLEISFLELVESSKIYFGTMLNSLCTEPWLRPSNQTSIKFCVHVLLLNCWPIVYWDTEDIWPLWY